MQTELVLSAPERLRLSRLRAGIDQEQMAEVIGVTRSVISAYETGKTEPTLTRLVRWADAVDVSLDWMCARRDSNPQPSDWESAGVDTDRITCAWCGSRAHDTDDCPRAEDALDVELQLLALA